MNARAFFVGLGLGAGVMYLLDPDRGKRRRSEIRDRGVGTIKQVGEAFERRSHDIGNRVHGVFAEATALLRCEEVDDETLLARVRSRIGHTSRHTHGVTVEVEDGCVTLSGTLPSDEVPRVEAAARKVRGVKDIMNLLVAVDETEVAAAEIAKAGQAPA